MLGWLFGKRDRPADDVCVACGSAELEALAPRAYRCAACGYEGGEGYAELADVKTRAAYDDWSTAQLVEHVRAQLNEARAALMSVAGLPQTGTVAELDDRIGRSTVRARYDVSAEGEWESLRSIALEREGAVAKAAAGLHSATLTLDALVDRGADELRTVLDEARAATEEEQDLRVRIDNALAVLG